MVIHSRVDVRHVTFRLITVITMMSREDYDGVPRQRSRNDQLITNKIVHSILNLLHSWNFYIPILFQRIKRNFQYVKRETVLMRLLTHFIFSNISKRIGCKECSRVNTKEEGDLDRFDFSEVVTKNGISL